MNDLQKKLLPILEWFHNFCKQNNLTYFALAGTVLGAVRHSGFIPWDDDIDVGMPRPDYERFKELTTGKTFEGKYVAEFPLVTDKFCYALGKVFDTTTTLVENKRYKQKKGVFLDVFPLDGLGNDKEDAMKHFKKGEKLFNKFNLRVCAIRPERAWYKNAAIIATRCIPEFIYSAKKVMKKLDAVCKERNYYESDLVCNFAGAYHEKEIAKREIFGSAKELKFENVVINVPEKVEEYLTGMYGEYNVLPPEEKRKTHHDYLFLDLNKGYMEK